MIQIPFLCFAETVFRCEISGKICEHGNCHECIVASYFIEFRRDDDDF